MLLLQIVAAVKLFKRNEEFQPILTSDFPHLLGVERVKAWMDDQKDPCNDFYSYACGSFQHRYESFGNTDILKLMGKTNALLMKQLLDQPFDALSTTPVQKDLFFKTKDYYMSCLNKQVIQERGFYPIKVMAFDILYKCDSWMTRPALIGDFQSQGISLFFKPIYSKVHFNDPNDLRLQLLPANAYDVSRETISTVFKIFQDNYIIPEFEDVEDLASIVHDIEQKMVRFVKNINSAVDDKSYSDQFTTLKELSWITGLDWEQYKQPMRLENAEKVYLWGDANEWKMALRYFGNLPHTHFKYYTLWRLATSHFNKLSPEYYKTWHENIFSTAIKADYDVLNKDPELFQQDCINELGVHLTYLSGHLYIKYAFNETQREGASEMIDNLMKTFRKRIHDLDWMDTRSKNEALAKLDNMINTVGYPKWLADPYLVASYHKSLTFNPNHYFENAVQAELLSSVIPSIHQTRMHHLNRVNTYHGYPWQLNAFHLSDYVQIQINPGILQRPLFSSENPNAMNYGSLGMVIGHEITHGFDSSGSKLDSRGIKRMWMSKSSKRNYDGLTKCFQKQYAKANVSLSDGTILHPDPRLTLGENMADNGGLHTAFAAWRETESGDIFAPKSKLQGFSPSQVFFLAFGQTWCSRRDDQTIKFLLKNDPHSPNPVRVNEAVKNHPMFEKAFKCKNQDKKQEICRIF